MAYTFNPTNPEKLKRATHIAGLVLGTVEVKGDEDQALKDRHAELLEQKEINLKDEEAVIESVYLALAGGIAQSPESSEAVAPKKPKAKKSK